MANIITLFNTKGGCGKSTAAFNLPFVFSSLYGDKSLVIDCDSQCNSSNKLLAYADRPKYTLYDVICGKDPALATAKALVSSRMNTRPKYFNVDCIAADKKLENANLLKKGNESGFGENLSKFISDNKYNWVFIDMPPKNQTLNRIIFKNVAEYILVPFSSDIDSVTAYNDLIEIIEEARSHNPALSIMGTYLARYMANCSVDKDIAGILEEFDDYINCPIPQSSDIKESTYLIKPISFYRPSSKGRIAFEELAEHIKKKAKE